MTSVSHLVVLRPVESSNVPILDSCRKKQVIKGGPYLILKPANYLQPRTADVWSYTQKIRNDSERVKPWLLEVPEGQL
jgi:hypothetical protein